MNKRWCWWLLAAALAWGCAAPAGWAQSWQFFGPNPPPRKAGPAGRQYVPIPFEGDLEAMLKAQLERAGRLEPLQDLWKKVQGDLKKYHIDPHQLPKLDLEDPQVHKLVQGWLEKPPPALKLSPEQVQKLREVLEQFEKGQAAPDWRPKPSAAPPAALPATTSGRSALTPDQNDLTRWLRDWLSEVEESELGDWLRDSPAWRSALEDAHSWLADPEGRLGWWGPDSLPRGWKIPEGLFQGGAERGWDALGNLSVPELPRVDLPHLRLPRLSWRPGRGSAALPTYDEGALVQCLGWLALLLAGSWLLWRIGKRRAWLRPDRTLAPRAWPVDPAQVTTAAQLIQAFEFLALQHLGAQARAWNHRRIAAHLATDDEQAQAAQELAACYEEARYAPAEEALTTAALAAARRHLCLLAEVAGP